MEGIKKITNINLKFLDILYHFFRFSKIKNLIKKVNIAYFSVIVFFIIMLLYIIASIFLFKKNKEDFNNLKNETEQAIKRLESKTDAFSSQLYRMRLMNQQYYYGHHIPESDLETNKN